MTTNFTASNSTAPPHAAAHDNNSDMSPLNAVLCLVAVITIPIISYTLFVAIKCPRNPCFWWRSSAAAPTADLNCKDDRLELVRGGSSCDDQCPVCLSAFAQGEEIRLLGACKHAFHAACIDMWLHSHSSCPVCRAAVPAKRSKRGPVVGGEDDDFRQGLPDSANLI
ncbi:hypothetical protein ACP275_12G169300 [Erythranthe tilingii]